MLRRLFCPPVLEVEFRFAGEVCSGNVTYFVGRNFVLFPAFHFGKIARKNRGIFCIIREAATPFVLRKWNHQTAFNTAAAVTWTFFGAVKSGKSNCCRFQIFTCVTCYTLREKEFFCTKLPSSDVISVIVYCISCEHLCNRALFWNFTGAIRFVVWVVNRRAICFCLFRTGSSVQLFDYCVVSFFGWLLYFMQSSAKDSRYFFLRSITL